MTDDVTTAALDAWVRRFAALVAQERDHLTELDSAIGDADHGTNMDRGVKAAVAALDERGPAGAGPTFTKVGMTLVSTVGGASGPLYGTLFLRMGTTLGDVSEGPAELVAQAFPAGVARRRGRHLPRRAARPGIRGGPRRPSRARQGGGQGQDDVRRAGPCGRRP